MANIVAHIANANGVLKPTNIRDITAAVQQIERRRVFEVLSIRHDVDVIFFGTKAADATVDVDGFTQTKYTIYITIKINGQYITADDIVWTICHELAHVRRNDSVGHGATLLDSMITEGLADSFAYEITGIEPWYAKHTNTEKLLTIAKPYLTNKQFSHNDYRDWFFNGLPSLHIPPTAGYQIGYHLVHEYLQQHGKKSWQVILRLTALFYTEA